MLLCNLLADTANHSSEINQWTGSTESNNVLNVGSLVVLPSTHIEVIDTSGRKCMILSRFRILLVISIFSQQ